MESKIRQEKDIFKYHGCDILYRINGANEQNTSGICAMTLALTTAGTGTCAQPQSFTGYCLSHQVILQQAR